METERTELLITRRHHHLRGPASSQRPEPPPSCPGCGGPIDAAPTEDGRLIGMCSRVQCGEWTVFTPSEDGRWKVRERIPRERRSQAPALPRRAADADQGDG